ncbi:TPA: hypothetical protein PXM37_002385 [Yersinia enterocolitica]|nr:hypothetical protein [Yersinia enterocolitica]HDL6981926.1 hypothetical protein [Yersinia enterocolitica]HDL7066037.1 hypothetical protein [Yersinia enterocolitica]HDL7070422.1 hypothetical protein [Yersinia enterocolitica]
MTAQTITKLQIECILKQQNLMFDKNGLKTLLLDKGFLLLRSVLGGRVIGGGVSLQVQEYIYHHYLSDEQKQAIYGSGYEIGSPLPVPDTSENAYHDYLAQTYGGIDVADLVKQIKKNITELTGIPFKVFLQKDRNLALKVVTLFYRICRIYRPQLFRLLKVESTDKANFEFRSAFPQQHEQSEENSAVLAEILCHLTFSMPKAYAEQAWRILTDLALTGEEMAVYVKSEIEGEQYQPGRYSRHNISAALNYALKKPTLDPVTEPDRLDFLLYASLALREYSERKKSNHLVMQAVYKNPLRLKTLRCATLPSFSDKDVLTFLTGKEVTRIKPSLEKQAEFVELIVRQYTRDITEPLPSMNKQIIKALILHDEKLGVHIPSAITGASNVQTSVTSILKDAERYARRDPEGNYPDLRRYPEALLLYWDMRYHMAVKALMSKQVEDGFLNMLSIAEWELQVDTGLIEYLQFSDMKTYQTFPGIVDKFMHQLGYQPGKVTPFTIS